MARKQEFTAKQVRGAIQDAGGNIARAADALGVSRRTVYDYIRRYKSLKDVVGAERRFKRAMRVDIAESNLDDALDSGDWRATEYVLSTLGKGRGYMRRSITQVSGSPDEPLPVALLTADEWVDKMREQAKRAGATLTN